MQEKLRMSEYVQTVQVDTTTFVCYHSLFGLPQIINQEGIELLEQFRQAKRTNDIRDASGYDNLEDTIAGMKNCFFLVPENLDERFLLQQRQKPYLQDIAEGRDIEYLSLIVTDSCNFACTYCIAHSMLVLGERAKAKQKLMGMDVAKKAVDFFFAKLKRHNKNNAYINFGGGEPLLNWKIILKVLSYCTETYGSDFEIIFTINTNASLITEEIANAFKTYSVKPALSLDGLSRANDAVRVTKVGGGTFTAITKGMDRLHAANYPPEGFSVTVTEKNFPFIDEKLIDLAVSRGYRYIRIDLDVLRLRQIPLKSVTKKLFDLKRYGETHDVSVSGFWERPLENFSHPPLEQHTSFCGGVVGKSFCVNHTGDAFICGYSNRCIGNVDDTDAVFGPDTAYYNIVSARLPGSISRCYGCPIEGQCAGGCHITEEFRHSSDDGALEYNCQLYRTMTRLLIAENAHKALLDGELDVTSKERR